MCQIFMASTSHSESLPDRGVPTLVTILLVLTRMPFSHHPHLDVFPYVPRESWSSAIVIAIVYHGSCDRLL